ncbi:hypothetical protein PtA15_16A358 [Puccinia triticina]|uniref:Actin interacting protein 3 C-terminal domain-containing protein n=1 Tax=Puccinia triticina TaxID=208348 RepID=A0ABY7D8U0_9BASI|nr:uncharacterized protein PtA15_16A358 [Puccinia triticina]WAQ92450.1 hypothetical protein PtA15_16A358 [Puccinia triticina]
MPRDSTPYDRKAVRTSARLGGNRLQIEPAAPDPLVGESSVESILKRCETQINQKVDSITARLTSLEKWNRELDQAQQSNSQSGNSLTKNEIQDEVNSYIRQAIHEYQNSFWREIEEAVALKGYATNSDLGNQIQHLSESAKAQTAHVSSIFETGRLELQGSLAERIKEVRDEITDNQKTVQKKLEGVELRASRLEELAKEYGQKLERQNQIFDTSTNDQGQITQAHVDQIELVLNQKFQHTIISANEELKAKGEEYTNQLFSNTQSSLEDVSTSFQVKLDFQDEAMRSQLQGMNGKLQDAMKRISDLEEKVMYQPANTFLPKKNHPAIQKSKQKVDRMTDSEPRLTQYRHISDNESEPQEPPVTNNPKTASSSCLPFHSSPLENCGTASGTRRTDANTGDEMDIDISDNEAEPDQEPPVANNPQAASSSDITDNKAQPQEPPVMNNPQAASSSRLPSHSSPLKNPGTASGTRRNRVKILSLSQNCKQVDLCTEAEKHDDQVLNRAMQSFLYYLAQQKQSKYPPLPQPTGDDVSSLKNLKPIDNLLQNGTYILDEYASVGPNTPYLISSEEVQRIGT